MNKKPGPPYGNQNARKHGFYSSALTPAEICEFWSIARLEGIDPEIAALRVKLKSLLQQDPCNRRALADASRLLVKWYCARYRFNRKDTSLLKKVIRSILSNCFIPSVVEGQFEHPAHTADDFYKTNRACFDNPEQAPLSPLNSKKHFSTNKKMRFIQNKSPCLAAVILEESRFSFSPYRDDEESGGG